jgi:murein DD-endopeptidase MepM/ murein hydrolase activator NlpD
VVIGSIGAVVTVSACALFAVAASSDPGQPPHSASAVSVTYVAPLPEPAEVVRGFDPPATRYGPGHLGVDLRARRGATVASAGAGVVRFAGPVAGRGVVVIEHPDGVRTEYEPVAPWVRAGAQVRAGDPIGVVNGRHAGCPGWCLHWGARRGDTYLNPLDLLRPLGPVVLLPDRRRTDTLSRDVELSGWYRALRPG